MSYIKADIKDIPGQWNYLQSEIGKTVVAPTRERAAYELSELRKANPRFGLKTDLESCLHDVELSAFTRLKRILPTNHHAQYFIPSPLYFPPPPPAYTPPAKAFRAQDGRDTRTCLVQLGRLGDIVNLLPVAFEMWRVSGVNVPIMVHEDFASILDGTSYCDKITWNGHIDDVLAAKREALRRFTTATITKVNGTGWPTQQQMPSYCQDSWRLAGFGDKWRTLPTLFDRRNPVREKALIEQIIGERKNVVLFCGNAISAPFAFRDQVISALRQSFEVIDLDVFRVFPPFDLLGLFDRAACLVTVDTMPLHLSRASQVPVVAFISDQYTPWHGSPPTENTICVVPYSIALTMMQSVIKAVGDAISRPKVVCGNKIVRRFCAIGDIIMASGVARKMAPVTLQCHPRVAELFSGDKEVKATGWNPGGPTCDIDLDMSYEGHVDQHTVPTQVLMARKAGLSDVSNLTPVLVASEDMKARVRQDWHHLQRPWIVVCPRSQMSRARTVPDIVWERVPDGRTWMWIGIHATAPAGFVHVGTDDLKYMLALMAEADLLVTVDSGPMHMAAAVGTPVVTITQSYRSDLQLTDQRDFRMVARADLTCLNCHERFCPIDRENPPCGLVDPKAIRQAANEMLQAYSGDSITAVIPVYKPKVQRLAKCIEHALRYIPEIVVSIDGDGQKPGDLLQTGLLGDPRIKWMSNPTGQRRGYGKTCNFGARHANGRFLLFLNDDVFLQEGTISQMKAAIQPAKVGGVGCLLRYPDGTLQHAGTGRSDGLVGYGHLDWKKVNPTIRQLTEIENVTHACFLVRREAFYDVLGYDERFDTYWEDNDLNLKLRQKGWKIMYEPNAWAIHEEHQTTDATGRTMEFYEHGKKLFEDKWRWYFQKNPANQLGTFV